MSTRSCQLGADAEEDRVEAASARSGSMSVTVWFELDVDAEVDDSIDLRVEDVSGQAVRGDAVAHHPAELFAASTRRTW